MLSRHPASGFAVAVATGLLLARGMGSGAGDSRFDVDEASGTAGTTRDAPPPPWPMSRACRRSGGPSVGACCW